MEHVVFHPTAEGKPAFERVSSLDGAVNFVEHLRNSENITEFSVYALTPVPLTFRAYYHVEVPADADAVADDEPRRRRDDAVDDDDRAEEWVAEATVIEPAATIDEQPDEAAPFADAPPVGAQAEQGAPADEIEAIPEPVSADVIPSGRRSMGFFAR